MSNFKKYLEETTQETNLSDTAKYFVNIITAVLEKDNKRILKFMNYIYSQYGKKEWWLEWLGYSSEDIKKNIIDVEKSI